VTIQVHHQQKLARRLKLTLGAPFRSQVGEQSFRIEGFSAVRTFQLDSLQDFVEVDELAERPAKNRDVVFLDDVQANFELVVQHLTAENALDFVTWRQQFHLSHQVVEREQFFNTPKSLRQSFLLQRSAIDLAVFSFFPTQLKVVEHQFLKERVSFESESEARFNVICDLSVIEIIDAANFARRTFGF